MVVDFGAGDDRQGVVEQVDQAAKHPRFGLAAESEKKNVVSRQNGVDDLRNDGFVITENIRKKRVAATEFGDQVAPHLVLDRLHLIAALAQLADCLGSLRRHVGSFSAGCFDQFLKAFEKRPTIRVELSIPRKIW